MYIRRIDEHPPTHPAAGRLGRHVRHDPRSLAYRYPARSLGALTSVRHERLIPILDQGDLGSCTGNAAEGALGTVPLIDAIPVDHPARPSAADADANEDQAVALYSAATALDGYDGEWPPDDTGSDGLSVAKACVAAGLISGYQHATSLEAALSALEARPVITGINWYSSFDEPSSTGRVRITPGAQVRGGHEFVLDELLVEEQLVGATNSWGLGWGDGGRFYIGWRDFERLLSEQGDVTVFVPLAEPAPTPVPDPSDRPGCLGMFLPKRRSR